VLLVSERLDPVRATALACGGVRLGLC